MRADFAILVDFFFYTWKVHVFRNTSPKFLRKLPSGGKVRILAIQAKYGQKNPKSGVKVAWSTKILLLGTSNQVQNPKSSNDGQNFARVVSKCKFLAPIMLTLKINLLLM